MGWWGFGGLGFSDGTGPEMAHRLSSRQVTALLSV